MGRREPLLKEQPVWQTQQTFCFWKNLKTQWHLFMESNRNTTRSHTVHQPGMAPSAERPFPGTYYVLEARGQKEEKAGSVP
jgi:hypothetical protein